MNLKYFLWFFLFVSLVLSLFFELVAQPGSIGGCTSFILFIYPFIFSLIFFLISSLLLWYIFKKYTFSKTLLVILIFVFVLVFLLNIFSFINFQDYSAVCKNKSNNFCVDIGGRIVLDRHCPPGWVPTYGVKISDGICCINQSDLVN